MAANTIDYQVRLDMSELSTRMHEARSMVSGVLGTPQSNMAGAAAGLTQFAGAATAGAAMMYGGLQRGVGTVGQYTDPNMAFQSHYGMVRAESSLAQEWAAYRGGAAGVAPFAPPGVGAGEYAQALQQNFRQRMTAAGAGFVGGAAPVVAGFAGWGVGAGIAKAVGMRAAAGSALGAISGGLSATGIGVAIGASMAAEHIVSSGIQRGNQIHQEVKQLGEIPTAGRGFSLREQFQFGRGMRDIASRMNIGVNQMGDIAAGIRASGMMPRTRDVEQSLRQFESMAKDIRDIAVGMKTSLGRATQYLKSVEGLGLGRGAGGVFSAASMAEGLGTSLGGLIAHVGMGRRVGMAAGIGGGVGGQVFLQSAFAGARGLGALQGPERLMVGGAMGLGRAFGMQAMQNAMGPWGQMQMMAMMGPTGARGLPGTAMGTLNQAAANIFGGGDPIANMVEFTTNRARMTRQLGATGIRQMQAQSIQTQAQMLMRLSPGMTQQRALQFVGMQSGLNEHQSRAMAGYIMRGFRDPRPSARVSGMPAAFAGGRSGQMAIRAAVDEGAREIAKATADEAKAPWTRAIEGIGNWWARGRQNMEIQAAEDLRVRQAAQGLATPTAVSLREAQMGFRTGTGMLAGAGVDLSAMGGAGGAAMQTVLAFGGAGTTGGMRGGIVTGPGTVITAGEASQAMRGIATQIGRLSGGAQNQETVIQAAAKIGARIESGKFNAKATAENLKWNLSKATGGSADPTGEGLQWLKGNIRDVLRGTEFEKGWKKQGLGIFGSEKGAEAMATINRFMRAQGVKGFDIGRTLRQAGARGISATALAMESRGVGMLERLMGRSGDIDEEARRIIQSKRAEQESVRRAPGSFGDPAGMRSASIAAARLVKIPTLAEARVLAKERMAGGQVAARGVLRSKSFQDYVKTRDRLYYQPWRQARAEANKKFTNKTADQRKAREEYVKQRAAQLKKEAREKISPKLEKAQRAAVLTESRASMKPGASKAAIRMVRTMDKDKKVVEDLAGAMTAVTGEKPKPARKRRRVRGRRVAFQGQAESFQGQVASALRKTSHTLNQIKTAMQAMEGRLKGTK